MTTFVAARQNICQTDFPPLFIMSPALVVVRGMKVSLPCFLLVDQNRSEGDVCCRSGSKKSQDTCPELGVSSMRARVYRFNGPKQVIIALNNEIYLGVNTHYIFKGKSNKTGS